jgi:hypothetical protein
MEEKEDSIDTEYSKYNHYKDSVLSILGIGNRKNRLDPSMDTTLEELKKLWSTIDEDDTDSTHSIDSDETPQPNVPTNPKLTIDGLHKIEGEYRKGVITDTLHNNDYYIIELHTNDRVNIPIEATIYREPIEYGKIRIDVREYGRAKVQYHTQREGFRNRLDFATELFALADDYIKGEYYK